MEKGAVLIGKAYEVLSDPDRRKTYDDYLAMQQTSTQTELQKSYGVDEDQVQSIHPTPAETPPPPNSTAPTSQLSWIIGGIVILLFLLSILFGSSSSQYQPTQIEQRQQAEQLTANQIAWAAREKSLIAQAEKEEAQSKISRTIPKLAVGITVKMPPSRDGFNHCSSYAICTHYVKIPTIGVIVRKNDADKIMQHIQINRELLVEGIKKTLSRRQYTEFTHINGEARLKEIIREQLDTAIVGYDNFAVSFVSQHKGIEEVLLPSSFSVH